MLILCHLSPKLSSTLAPNILYQIDSKSQQSFRQLRKNSPIGVNMLFEGLYARFFIFVSGQLMLVYLKQRKGTCFDLSTLAKLFLLCVHPRKANIRKPETMLRKQFCKTQERCASYQGGKLKLKKNLSEFINCHINKNEYPFFCGLCIDQPVFFLLFFSFTWSILIC